MSDIVINIDEEDLKDYLRLASDIVIKNTEIVYQSEEMPVMYHLALEKRPELIPNVSKRTATGEDNTMPRVCVAATLLHCVKGYGSIANHAINHFNIGSKEDKGKKEHVSQSYWRGGFYIHAIDYRVALKPNNKLVPDASKTKEYWLVGYNEMTRCYEAAIVGKFILEKVNYIPASGGYSDEELTLLIEIKDDVVVKLDTKHNVYKGYWRAVLLNDTVVSLVSVEKKEWEAIKTVSASMLSLEQFDQTKPKFLKWE